MVCITPDSVVLWKGPMSWGVVCEMQHAHHDLLTGPINSWDRLPFLTDVSGVDSFETVPSHVTENFIFANYGNHSMSSYRVKESHLFDKI
jgi:hypothetical protein